MIAGDREGVCRAAAAIGYLSGQGPEKRQRALADLLVLAGEPLSHRGAYDFGASRLARRARDAGFELVIREGFMRGPPPEMIFPHRKLAGIFLLCGYIRARVDTGALVARYL
jgi:hypothetical protein